MTVILDYGAGNLRSVANTLESLNANYSIVRTGAELSAAKKIILPGVGHFGQMMRELDRIDARTALLERLDAGVPFLGICLGMQALFEGSEEAPGVPGLGIFQGRAVRFNQSSRVPHMGWNRVCPQSDSVLFRHLETSSWFYFAHSYYIPTCDVSSALCSYGPTYSAGIEQQNIFGVQFHPEKSSAAGQQLMRRFLEI